MKSYSDRYIECNLTGYTTEQEFQIAVIERQAVVDAATNTFLIGDRTRGWPSEFRNYYSNAYASAGGLTPVQLKCQKKAQKVKRSA